MNDEKTTAENPIGLYRDPASGQFVGAIDPIQADAFVRTGFVLHEEGRDAAMTSQEDLDALSGSEKLAPGQGGSYEPSVTKKGK